MIAQPVFAEEHSGSIGDIIWSISDDGVLKVSGTGAMPDYTSSTFSDAPWYAYESLITGIIIDSGVTHIGDYCFYNENNGFYKELTSVEILDAETIGECAFALCDQLENITFKGNAPQIAADAFSDVTANAYYIGACESWTEEKLANYGGTLTWNSVECSHVYSSVVTEPTCTEDGFTTYTCSVCGDNYVDDTVEKLGHSYQDVVTEPTCLEDGFTTHTCSHCEDSYIDSYVDKLGHDYVGVETPATCTKEGITIYCCANCDATNEETIPMLSSCPTQGYSDVPGVSNWAHEGIDFCITRSIMGSTSTARLVFEPGISCTRSMIVSILYRLSGEPDVTFEAAFPDVKAGQWYSNAVIWAYHNGVVRGYDTGKFGPNDIITREQMAVILKGYTENILQQDTSASTTLNSFADCAKVKWSKDYVSWAVAVGMISGKTQQDGTVLLDPQGNASRSEVASILMRFVQNLVEA